LPGKHGHALTSIDLQGSDQLTIDFIKHGRADVWQGAAPLVRIGGWRMLQAQLPGRLQAMIGFHPHVDAIVLLKPDR
jgi:hypothetical protein